jgi:hypothetical protein
MQDFLISGQIYPTMRPVIILVVSLLLVISLPATTRAGFIIHYEATGGVVVMQSPASVAFPVTDVENKNTDKKRHHKESGWRGWVSVALVGVAFLYLNVSVFYTFCLLSLV